MLNIALLDLAQKNFLTAFRREMGHDARPSAETVDNLLASGKDLNERMVDALIEIENAICDPLIDPFHAQEGKEHVKVFETGLLRVEEAIRTLEYYKVSLAEARPAIVEELSSAKAEQRKTAKVLSRRVPELLAELSALIREGNDADVRLIGAVAAAGSDERPVSMFDLAIGADVPMSLTGKARWPSSLQLTGLDGKPIPLPAPLFKNVPQALSVTSLVPDSPRYGKLIVNTATTAAELEPGVPKRLRFTVSGAQQVLANAQLAVTV